VLEVNHHMYLIKVESESNEKLRDATIHDLRLKNPPFE
jgi:hypothetical protein